MLIVLGRGRSHFLRRKTKLQKELGGIEANSAQEVREEAFGLRVVAYHTEVGVCVLAPANCHYHLL